MFKPDGKPTRRWLLTLAVLAALIGALWFNQHQGIKHVTRETQKLGLQNCNDIEDLKSRVRLRAQEDYANLDRNGDLLGIKITAALRAQALHDKNETLRKYAPEACPRP